MKTLVLISLFLFSCGAQMQMAPVAPPFPTPAYTPPGRGAPTYDPAPARPRPEPSPNKRVLPSTKEPGLWAADAPTASAQMPAPKVVDVILPLPPYNTSPNLVYICARSLDAIFSQHKLSEEIMKLTFDERSCLIGYLFRQCGDRMRDEIDRMQPFDRPALEPTRKLATEFARRKCNVPGAHSNRVRDLIDRLYRMKKDGN